MYIAKLIDQDTEEIDDSSLVQLYAQAVMQDPDDNDVTVLVPSGDPISLQAVNNQITTTNNLIAQYQDSLTDLNDKVAAIESSIAPSKPAKKKKAKEKKS